MYNCESRCRLNIAAESQMCQEMALALLMTLYPTPKAMVRWTILKLKVSVLKKTMLGKRGNTLYAIMLQREI